MPTLTKPLSWQEGAIEMINRFSLIGFSALLAVCALSLPASAHSVRPACSGVDALNPCAPSTATMHNKKMGIGEQDVETFCSGRDGNYHM
jgi:hypothetical protein